MKAEDWEIWKCEINYTNWILFFPFRNCLWSTCQPQLDPLESKDSLLRILHFDQLPAKSSTGCKWLQLGWRVSLTLQLSKATQTAQKIFLCLEFPSLAAAQPTAPQSMCSAVQEDAGFTHFTLCPICEFLLWNFCLALERLFCVFKICEFAFKYWTTAYLQFCSNFPRMNRRTVILGYWDLS